jgi:spore maturation protein CgeB
MRVLVSGAFNPAFEALPEYLLAALRRLGHEVTGFDHRAFLLPGRLRARSGGLDRLDRAALNRRFVCAARRFRPDLVLVNQGMVLTGTTIGAVRAQGARCVNWFSDYPAEFETGLERAPAYDAFFLGASYAARRHVEAGHARSMWLPFACDPEVHHPRTEKGERARRAIKDRVVFVGSCYPERQILLRFLRGLPVGIWGPGWEARAASDPHLAPMLRGGALRPSDWRALYQSADVALNIHYGTFGPLEVSGDLANTRLFEIFGCGAFQVVDRQGDVLRLFRDGQEFSGFSSGDELRAAVETALRDEDRRRAVAASGRRAVLAAHTYEQRARMLLDPSASGFPVRDLPLQDPVTGPAGMTAARAARGARR